MSTDTAAPEAADEGSALAPWVGGYLRDHAIHIAVVAFFIVYPFLYDVLVGQFGLPAEMLLPRLQTMLVVLWLGLFAMSFDFISGYTGYLSFGHAAFFGIGAYTVVLGANGQLPLLPGGLSFMTLMLVSALLAVVVALLIGLVSFRLSGVYFAMITLGFAEIMYVASRNWDWLTPGQSDPSDGINTPADFNPELGVPFVDPLQVETGVFGDDAILGINFGDLLVYNENLGAIVASYFAIGAVVLVCYLAMQRIIHSPFGRVMIAIRENEERAKAIGYDTFKFKLGAFMISAFFGAVAGALLVAYRGSVNPDAAFFFLVTGFALVAAIIGGLGTLAGPFFGYIFLEGIEEFLARGGSGGGLQPFLEEFLPGGILEMTIGGDLTISGALDAFMTGHGEFYAGIIFVIFVLYVPIGILGTLRLRLGADSVATYVSRRLGGSTGTGGSGGGGKSAAAESTTAAESVTAEGGEEDAPREGGGPAEGGE
ncbi:branched-chain amino acid ABC transporter permease [Halobacteriales archaeon SW_7_65_23]|nr:MAG: branched-chain amino acid ABC transporter permease [Halobacteriales archaeon SW_7_65_23]